MVASAGDETQTRLNICGAAAAATFSERHIALSTHRAFRAAVRPITGWPAAIFFLRLQL